ncbi:hypothetical protein [Neisseria sp. Ec49-e6-T10]|uniref:hypothetical protein n=1 Tax=Neisseria sp. Ec49-e6-T10 TaxID=3140744 RepID=UPI003EB79F89
MNQTKLIICLSAILLIQDVLANDDIPSLPSFSHESVTDSSSQALGSLSLDLKSQAMADWAEHDSPIASGRISTRLYGQGNISDSLSIELNTRLRSQINSREHYQAEKNIRLDIQSLALNYTPTENWHWIAGRTNIRNGVASGFNPTDWFKNNSQVIFESLDTTDRREDRLGVFALMGVWLNTDSVLSFGYRPNLPVKSKTVASNSKVIGMGLDRTNNQDAFFIKYSPSPASWNNLSLTVSSLYQSTQPSLGTELSLTVLDNLVLYSEWFVQRRQNLADEAQSNIGNQRFYHQLVNGVTWSLPESLVDNKDISMSLEYHFNEAGLKQSQLGSWRRAIAHSDWRARSIASLANIKQEPLAQQQFFNRMVWNNFWKNNDLSIITTVTPMDGSGFSQVTLSTPVMPALRMNLQGYHYFGSHNTIYGSTGRKGGIMLSFTYTI